MKRQIVITVHDTGEDFAIDVEVSEGMNTLEAIGLLDIAKAQHLASKHRHKGAVYQAPDAQVTE